MPENIVPKFIVGFTCLLLLASFIYSHNIPDRTYPVIDYAKRSGSERPGAERIVDVYYDNGSEVVSHTTVHAHDIKYIKDGESYLSYENGDICLYLPIDERLEW